MKKKSILLLSATVLMSVMLSACGSTSNSTNQSSNSTSSSAQTADKSAQKTQDSSKTADSSNAATGNVVDIKVNAKDFEYDKKEIHVKKGDKVKITLQSDDGGHGLAIPAYNVNIQGNNSAEFVADKTGTFEYHCSVMCGSGHANMTGKLIVE
ncbi:cupredoxin domain-containing protein [Neobacillus massiliamazoniensis]|uniref:Cytochrome C oxidase subunit II n=1 Tax=Neobacillus massiliamazoniensis TaxID=1499688 RepID=A0A0U1NZ40_9BACI|nr:cupredoxin domain-containing protein [Neobacillus massiliamazoniensis]CRK83304.1 cytochrome C oxidase subunit II [Neobacillus massiliamazoniensis]